MHTKRRPSIAIATPSPRAWSKFLAIMHMSMAGLGCQARFALMGLGPMKWLPIAEFFHGSCTGPRVPCVCFWYETSSQHNPEAKTRGCVEFEGTAPRKGEHLRDAGPWQYKANAYAEGTPL